LPPVVEWGMTNGLSDKMEKYSLYLFQGLSQRRAYLQAGYAPGGRPAILDKAACYLAGHPKVVARLAELRGKAEDDAISDVKERKQRLTEFIRGNVTHYMDDGGKLVLAKDTPRSGAVAEWQVKQTKYGEQRLLKLHDPIQAISELNRMERIYEVGATINQDNRTVNIYVVDDEARELLGRVKDRTREVEGD